MEAPAPPGCGRVRLSERGRVGVPPIRRKSSVRQPSSCPAMSRGLPRPAFELQFPPEQIASLADRFPKTDDRRTRLVGAAVRARGHYTRDEFIEVCAWKTPRTRPRVASNSEAAVIDATGRAVAGADEATRFAALLELNGVGAPTASTLLYVAFPDDYPILDVRALESLGVKPRSTYPVSFWLAYLEACRSLARGSGVSIRTLDKALWQRSKERRGLLRVEPGVTAEPNPAQPPRQRAGDEGDGGVGDPTHPGAQDAARGYLAPATREVALSPPA